MWREVQFLIVTVLVTVIPVAIIVNLSIHETSTLKERLTDQIIKFDEQQEKEFIRKCMNYLEKL